MSLSAVNMTEKLFTGTLRINQPTNHCQQFNCLGNLSMDLGLKSHPKDWRSLAGIELMTPGLQGE